MGHVQRAEVEIAGAEHPGHKNSVVRLHHQHDALLNDVELMDIPVEVAVLPAALGPCLGADVGAAVRGAQAEPQLAVVHPLMAGGDAQVLGPPGAEGRGHDQPSRRAAMAAAGSTAPYTAEPATRVSAPAEITLPAVLGLMPPSTSSRQAGL